MEQILHRSDRLLLWSAHPVHRDDRSSAHRGITKITCNRILDKQLLQLELILRQQQILAAPGCTDCHSAHSIRLLGVFLVHASMNSAVLAPGRMPGRKPPYLRRFSAVSSGLNTTEVSVALRQIRNNTLLGVLLIAASVVLPFYFRSGTA